MGKPPAAPPSSDVKGVNRDRKAIDHPSNAERDPGKDLKHADTESKGHPRSDPEND